MTKDEHRRRLTAFFTKDVTIKDIVFAVAGLVAALGFSINSPNKRIDALVVNLAGATTRIDHAERRIDTLAEAQRFTNYMLCVNARRTDPASAPPDCVPIIEARSHR